MIGPPGSPHPPGPHPPGPHPPGPRPTGPRPTVTRRTVLGGSVAVAAAATVGLVLGLRDRSPAPAPVPPPTLRWQLPALGNRTVVRLVPGPGIAVVLAGLTAVEAVELDTGRVRWSYPADVASSNVATTEDTVHVTVADALDAVDARTGRRRWRTPNCRTITAAATAVIAWRSGAGVPYDYALAGLDPRDGTIKWQTEIGTAPTYDAVATANGLVHLAVGQEVLTVDDVDGRITWRHEFPVRPVNLQLSDGVLAVTGLSRDRVTALDAHTGELRWEQPGNPGGSSAPSVAAVGRTFVVQASNTVSGWDPDDGDELWSASPSATGVPGFGGGLPIAGPATVVTLDSHSTLEDSTPRPSMTGYDASDGTQLWSVPLPSELSADTPYASVGGPFVADGTLVYSDRDGVVRGYGPIGR